MPSTLLKMTESERAQLDALAAVLKTNRSECLRRLVAEMSERLGVAPVPPSQRTQKRGTYPRDREE